jgi:O-antigen/teichoic acid export membrane protein
MPIRSILRIFATEVLSKVVLGLSHILIIKALPVTEFSRFSFLYATAFAVSNFSGVALNRAMMVQAAKEVPGERPILAGALLSCLGAAALMAGVGAVGGYSRAELSAVGVFAFGFLIVDYLRSLHQSELGFREYALIEVVRSTLILGATAAALLGPGRRATSGAAEAILWYQGAVMLLLAVPWVALVRRARLRVDVVRLAGDWRRHLDGDRLALFAYFAAVGLLGQIEIFVLKRAGTELDLAVFSAAFRYFTLLLMATGAMSAVLTPLSQKTDSAHSFLELLRRGRAFFLLFSSVALLSIPVLWVARAPLGLDKYPGFLAVYAVLSLVSVQAVFLSPHVSALMRLRDHAFLNAVAYLAIAASVAACFLLVRAAGAWGAAVSYLGTNLFLNGLAYRRAHKLVSGAGEAGPAALAQERSDPT